MNNTGVSKKMLENQQAYTCSILVMTTKKWSPIETKMHSATGLFIHTRIMGVKSCGYQFYWIAHMTEYTDITWAMLTIYLNEADKFLYVLRVTPFVQGFVHLPVLAAIASNENSVNLIVSCIFALNSNGKNTSKCAT